MTSIDRFQSWLQTQSTREGKCVTVRQVQRAYHQLNPVRDERRRLHEELKTILFERFNIGDTEIMQAIDALFLEGRPIKHTPSLA